MLSKLGKDIPKLGFGLMRLPMAGGLVDIAETNAMVDAFLQGGFTYFDTAYGYLDGASEQAAKTCVVDRYARESFQLATKLPAWDGAVTAQQAQDMFWTSLRRTGAEYFDFYLLHNLGDSRTAVFDEYELWEFIQLRKQQGLIRHIGFSFHDKADVLAGILSRHPEVEFVQLQINYADWLDLSIESKKCYDVCVSMGKPVVIMEPLKGGFLSQPIPEVEKLLKEADPNVSCSSWGLRFAASLDHVVTVLSGMSNMEQMRDNVKTMNPFVPLSPEQMRIIQQAMSLIAQRPGIPCTNCQYCLKGCPAGIHIPLMFKAMNSLYTYDLPERAKSNYRWALNNGARATQCTACGACEAVCPQHIDIVREMKCIGDTLDN